MSTEHLDLMRPVGSVTAYLLGAVDKTFFCNKQSKLNVRSRFAPIKRNFICAITFVFDSELVGIEDGRRLAVRVDVVLVELQEARVNVEGDTAEAVRTTARDMVWPT